MKNLLRLFAVMCVVAGLATQTLAQSKSEKIDKLLSQYQHYGQFNGTALVSEGGKVIFSKGYGMANMEWEIPNTPDTKFRLGSITKQFTAMLILQLVDEGKLKLDGTISDYLPSYPQKTGKIITIHHLLTHTSGIPSYTSFPGFMRDESRNPTTPREFIKIFADSTLEFEPGSQYRYNNSAYFLLGVIIEELTGMTYAEALQKRILDPVGMTDTGYDMPYPIIPKRAAGYEKSGGGYVNANYLDMTLPYSAGSLYSTVEDLYKWDQALYERKLLSKEMWEAYFAPHVQTGPPGAYYAYGWGVGYATLGESKDSAYATAHGGGINGFNTLITRIPSDRNLIVLLNNTGGAPLGPMSRAIYGILYDKPYAQARLSVADELRKIVDRGDLEAARQEFFRMKSDKKSYFLRERDINNLGYEYLQAGRIEDAVFVFTLNVEAHPESWNVYDSLGEAHMLAGDDERAIELYRTSLEINPDNSNAVAMLQRLGVEP